MDLQPLIRKSVLTRGIAWAIIIMKRFDEEHYGKGYRKIWKKEREKRYEFDMPAGPKYMLLPHIMTKK